MGLYNEVVDEAVPSMPEVSDTTMDDYETPCSAAPWPKQLALVELQLLEARNHLNDFY